MRVVQRHRLPAPYRLLLVVVWLLPIPLLVGAILLGQGFTPALLDPRLWLSLGAIALPAVHIWREGIDVLADGLTARMGLIPRYYPFASLEMYYYDPRPSRRTLTVWKAGGEKILVTHAAHLTAFPALLATLKAHVRDRRFPG